MHIWRLARKSKSLRIERKPKPMRSKSTPKVTSSMSSSMGIPGLNKLESFQAGLHDETLTADLDDTHETDIGDPSVDDPKYSCL